MSLATVIFTGVVLLQPNTTTNVLTAVMPEASNGATSVNVTTTGKTFAIPPHLAYVLVKTSQVINPAVRTPALQFVKGGEVMNLYYIQDNETFELVSDTKDSLVLSPNPGTGGREKFKDNVVETHQLASAAKLKASPDLAGRVTMKGGTMFAAHVTSHNWTFANSDLTTTRKQAEAVFVDINVTVNRVDLVSSGGASKKIELSDNVANPIVVEFGNGTFLAIAGACVANPKAKICNEGDNDRFDFHYEIFARLFDGNYLKGGKPPIPRSDTPTKHPTGSNCPPQYFQ